MAAASKYPARAVNIHDEDDAHPGSLTVTDEALSFASSSLTIQLPYEDLILDFASKRNSAVNFQHPDHPQWRITAYEHRILREPAFGKHAHLKQQIRDVRSGHQGVGQVITTIFFVAMLIGAGYLAGYAVERSVPKLLASISPARDVEIGKALQPLVEKRYPTNTSLAGLETQLDAILARLIPETDQQRFQFQSHVIDTPELIAFSLPGGAIYVSSALIRLATSAEQVAGILAHEAGHILNRDAVRTIVTRQGASMILRGLLGDQQSIVTSVAGKGDQLIAPTYPPAIDLEADGTAWTLMLTANISPEAIPSLQSLLNERIYSEGNEERPHPTISPSKERWAYFGQKQLALDKKTEFEPLPPLERPAAPSEPLSLPDL